MIKKEFYCGEVCAYGGVYIYKLSETNKWMFILILNSWNS
jgi:hypothetical protein